MATIDYPEEGGIALLRDCLHGDSLNDSRYLRQFFSVDSPAMTARWMFSDELYRALEKLDMVRQLDADGIVPIRRINTVPVSESKSIYVVTDLPATVHNRKTIKRAWPYSDEASTLLQALPQHLNRLREGSRVLDLCTGPGSVAIGIQVMRPDLKVTAVDIDDDSIILARLNTRLNGLDPNAIDWRVGDVATALKTEPEPFDLVVADPSFNLLPSDYPTDQLTGGKYGDVVLNRILTNVPDMLSRESTSRVIFLAYSLGGEEIESTRLAKSFSQMVPSVELKVQRAGERVWRYEHRKAFTNPMRVEYMVLRLGDQTRAEAILNQTPEEQTWKIGHWISWIEQLRSEDYTHLHYLLGIGKWIPTALNGKL